MLLTRPHDHAAVDEAAAVGAGDLHLAAPEPSPVLHPTDPRQTRRRRPGVPLDRPLAPSEHLDAAEAHANLRMFTQAHQARLHRPVAAAPTARRHRRLEPIRTDRGLGHGAKSSTANAGGGQRSPEPIRDIVSATATTPECLQEAMTDEPATCSDGDLLRGDLGDAALQLATTGFVSLWHGRPVSASEPQAGPSLATSLLETQAAAGRLELDELGDLVGIHGLTLRPTRHHIEHAGQRHYTWCAFDSIGIPAALQITASAHTDCPTCHQELVVEIVRGEPSRTDTVLWLPASSGKHLMNDFCASADLYCSAEHLHDRIDVHATTGSVTTLADAATLGRDVWSDITELDLTAPRPSASAEPDA